MAQLLLSHMVGLYAHARRHRGHWGATPPVAAGAPQMKILQMGLHASDLAPLCSV